MFSVRNNVNKKKGNRMKKITSLQVAFLMSLALGSSFMTECYEKSDKYAEKSAKAKRVKAAKEDTMKCI